MRKRCEEILLQLGITPDLLGFTYIADIVDIINSEDTKMTAIYHAVANKHNSNWQRVERAVRHAISKANPRSKEFEELINASLVKQSNGNISNSAFLHTLAYRLREE